MPMCKFCMPLTLACDISQRFVQSKKIEKESETDWKSKTIQNRNAKNVVADKKKTSKR